MKLSIIIPCFNELSTIEEIISNVKNEKNYSKEIIVIDDGSTDGTRDILKNKFLDKVDHIIYNDKNHGKGYSIRKGIKLASGDILIIQDADLEYDPSDYSKLVEPIKNGYADDKFESIFATKKMLLAEGTPNISVAVDLYGDVYGYREAAFLDRPGSKRYILGRIDKENSFEDIIKDALLKKRTFSVKESDLDYLDAWDHIVLRTLNQAKQDENFGIPFENGPVIGRTYNRNTKLEDYRTHFSNPKA